MTLSTRVLAKLEGLLERRAEAKKAIAEAEVEVKAIDATLKTMAHDAGGGMETPAWKITEVQGKSVKLDKQKLVALGVRPTLIAKAEVTTEYSYVKVTAKKASAGEGE